MTTRQGPLVDEHILFVSRIEIGVVIVDENLGADAKTFSSDISNV